MSNDISHLGRRLLSHRARGFSAVENSRSALEAACDSRVAFIELDTRITRDGQVVIHHDRAVTSTKGLVLPICRISATELREFRYGNGAPIMWLEDALNAFRDRSVPGQTLCLDLKDFGAEDHHWNRVSEAGIADTVSFISWIPQSLLRLRQIAPASPLYLSYLSLFRSGLVGRAAERLFRSRIIRVGSKVFIGASRCESPLGRYERGWTQILPCTRIPPSLLNVLRGSGGGVCVCRSALCPRLYEYVREENLNLWVFNSTTPSEFLALAAEPAVDVVFSDDAGAVLAMLAEKGPT